MFVYNLTIKIDNKILPQWMEWVREEYIPALMATGLFYSNKFFELVEEDKDPESSTFVLQHFTDSQEKYNKYIKDYSTSLFKKALQKWSHNFVSFTTLMRAVQ